MKDLCMNTNIRCNTFKEVLNVLFWAKKAGLTWINRQPFDNANLLATIRAVMEKNHRIIALFPFQGTYAIISDYNYHYKRNYAVDKWFLIRKLKELTISHRIDE